MDVEDFGMEERVLCWEDKSFDKDDGLKKFVHNLWFKPFPWEDKDIIAQILYNSKSVNEGQITYDYYSYANNEKCFLCHGEAGSIEEAKREIEKDILSTLKHKSKRYTGAYNQFKHELGE